MSKEVIPLGTWVLCRAKKDNVSEGGIILPDNTKKEEIEYRVVNIGSDVKKIKVGDQLLFFGQMGVKVDVKCCDNDLCLIQEEKVLGILIDKR